MKPFEAKDYKAFTMFEERWALVTAGTLDDLIRVQLVGAVWATYGGLMAAIFPR